MNPETIFFLGAGASVHAGVPPLLEMTRKFSEALHGDGKQDLAALYDAIVSGIKSKNANFEEVLGLLYQLLDLTAAPAPALASFVKLDTSVANHGSLQNLRLELEAFIREQVLKPDQKTVESYLAPLLSPNWPRPVEIFSVNYDICVELLCRAQKWRIIDGFEPEWNPSLLREARDSAKDSDTVLLHKLHGSALWYRAEDGVLVKNHLRPDPRNPGVRTFDGQRADQLLLYPAFKQPKESPFLDLAQLLRERLSQVKFVVVIGYSFVDDYLLHIFRDAFAQNSKAHMILIDPNAREIYSRIIKEPAFRPVFENRVSCCPFRVENFLKDFTQQEFGRLARTLDEFNKRSSQELTTAGVQWADFLSPGNYDQDIDFDLARRVYQKGVPPNSIPLYLAAKKLALAIANGDDKESNSEYGLVIARMWQEIALSAELRGGTQPEMITCRDVYSPLLRDATDRFLKNLLGWSSDRELPDAQTGPAWKLVEFKESFADTMKLLDELRGNVLLDRFVGIIKDKIPDISGITLPLARTPKTGEECLARIKSLLKDKVPKVLLPTVS